MGMPDRLVEEAAFDVPGMHSSHQMSSDSMAAPMGRHKMDGDMHSDTENPQRDMHSEMMNSPAKAEMKGSMGSVDAGGKLASDTVGSSDQAMPTQAHEKMENSQAHMNHSGTMETQGNPGATSDQSSDKGTMASHSMVPDMISDETQIDHVSSARSFGYKFGFLETDIASRQNLATEGGIERPGTPLNH